MPRRFPIVFLPTTAGMLEVGFTGSAFARYAEQIVSSSGGLIFGRHLDWAKLGGGLWVCWGGTVCANRQASKGERELRSPDLVSLLGNGSRVTLHTCPDPHRPQVRAGSVDNATYDVGSPPERARERGSGAFGRYTPSLFFAPDNSAWDARQNARRSLSISLPF